MPDHLLFSADAHFEAARLLPGAPDGHRAQRLHGHGFCARVRAALPSAWSPFPGAEVGELRTCLHRCIEPLDYRLLNDCIPEPGDEQLAHWVRDALQVPGVEQIDIRSGPRQGAVLDRQEQAHIWRAYRFEAAHRLPNVPPEHKCGRMHGHGFEVVLHARLADGQHGVLLAQRLDRIWQPMHEQFEGACLNELPGLENPTSERIAAYVWQRLKPALAELSWVTVHETHSCGAHFDGRLYRIWTELSLDSAVRLTRAPAAEPRGRLHGHTYRVRLHLNAPLDQVFGWTVDFGDVKEIFRPVFLRLDHHPLHEIPDIEDADSASIARWIRRQVQSGLPQLDRIDVYEASACGAILAWGKDDAALPV